MTSCGVLVKMRTKREQIMSLVKEHVIALVDCDCFFVSCERVDNLGLNGKPVCVPTGATSKGALEKSMGPS